MNILIAGASGFVGHNLVKSLQKKHQITVLGRDKALLERVFPADIPTCTWDNLANMEAKNYDAIINLCGYNISAKRWSKKIKQTIIVSRVATSTDLINWAIQQQAKPHFYCANAVGIYGMQKKDDPTAFDENSPIDFEHPCDFLSEIGIRWQQALQPALDQGIPVTITRFGVVLQKGQGMLKKLEPSFYCGLGAIVGDGKQVISWVHVADLIGAYSFLLDRPELTGAFNITSPNPVSQFQFATILAKTMHRPLFLKIPAVAIRLLFGEMGEDLLLNGQRVIPKRLIDEGFHFHYPDLASALACEY